MEAAVRALVDVPNRAGGGDNITALAFRFEDAAAPRAAPATRAPVDEGATLVGAAAEEAGLTATEVRRRAAAEAARKRREEQVAKPRRRRLRTAGKVAAVVLVVAALVLGAWYGSRQIWFLGTDSGGRVALYRGLPYELPFGIDLYEEHYASPVQTSSLPPNRQDSVTGHDLRSRSDATSLIEDIERSQGIGAAANEQPQVQEGKTDSKGSQPKGSQPQSREGKTEDQTGKQGGR
jgi:protein phosphatase